ncbi:MAG: hypothetical protein Q8Q90_00805 [bacterium]|nr:hypothetical protein [bacterium]
MYETIWKSGEMKGVEFGYHPLAAHSFQIGVSAGMVSKREIGIHPRGWSMGARLEHKSGLFAQAMRADGSNNIFVGLRLVTFGSIDASRRPIKLIKRR